MLAMGVIVLASQRLIGTIITRGRIVRIASQDVLVVGGLLM